MEDDYSLIRHNTTFFVVRTVTATPIATITTVQQELSRPYVEASLRVSVPVNTLFDVN
jgi:hypothetical protein